MAAASAEPLGEAASVVPTAAAPGSAVKQAWSASAPAGSTDERRRMRLNGETKAAMDYIREATACGVDHSVDQPWEVDRSLWVADAYVLTVTGIWLLVKLLVFAPVMLPLQLLPLSLLTCRAWCLPTPCRACPRAGASHYLFLAALVPLSLPVLALALLSYVLDLVAYYLFSVAYCAVTCGWARYCKSQAALRPYRGGPSLLAALPDAAVAALGAVHRQGLLEGCVMMTGMLVAIPWIKYFVNANPFVYPLEPRFVQQISTSLQDIPEDEITEHIDNIIVTCKHKEQLRRELDPWWFLPHYPEPPPWRRWAIGMQAAGLEWPPVGGFAFLVVHTTHASSSAGGCREQHMASSSGLRPWKRVMLWYNNPYHFLTGWVEAHLSTGGKAQPDKNRAGEHPMWLVGARSPWHCSRHSPLSIGFIDRIFDRWLPSLVHLVRREARGKEAADELFEGVVSKDGLSRPACGKRVPLVPGRPAAP